MATEQQYRCSYPFLALSRKYNVPYSAVLIASDHLEQRGLLPQRLLEILPMACIHEVRKLALTPIELRGK